MTEQEMLIRAREACASVEPGTGIKRFFLSGDHDDTFTMRRVLRALRDYDKPLSIDPDLVEARELCAKLYEGDGFTTSALSCRLGNYDGSSKTVLALAGIKRGRALASGDA
jgi:hypothetical protein